MPSKKVSKKSNVEELPDSDVSAANLSTSAAIAAPFAFVEDTVSPSSNEYVNELPSAPVETSLPSIARKAKSVSNRAKYSNASTVSLNGSADGLQISPTAKTAPNSSTGTWSSPSPIAKRSVDAAAEQGISGPLSETRTVAESEGSPSTSPVVLNSPSSVNFPAKHNRRLSGVSLRSLILHIESREKERVSSAVQKIEELAAEDDENWDAEDASVWMQLVNVCIDAGTTESLQLACSVLNGNLNYVSWRQETAYLQQRLDALLVKPSSLPEHRSELESILDAYGNVAWLLCEKLHSTDMPWSRAWSELFANFNLYHIQILEKMCSRIRDAAFFKNCPHTDAVVWFEQLRTFLETNQRHQLSMDEYVIWRFGSAINGTLQVTLNGVNENGDELGQKLGGILDICLSVMKYDWFRSRHPASDPVNIYDSTIRYIFNFLQFSSNKRLVCSCLAKALPTLVPLAVLEQNDECSSELVCNCPESYIQSTCKDIIHRLAFDNPDMLASFVGQFVNAYKCHARDRILDTLFRIYDVQHKEIDRHFNFFFTRILDIMTNDSVSWKPSDKLKQLARHTFRNFQAADVDRIEKALADGHCASALREVLKFLSERNPAVMKGRGAKYYEYTLKTKHDENSLPDMNCILACIALTSEMEAERIVDLMESQCKKQKNRTFTNDVLGHWRDIALVHPSIIEKRKKLVENFKRDPMLGGKAMDVLIVLKQQSVGCSIQ